MSSCKYKRIFYVGPLRIGGTCMQRFQALLDLAYVVHPFDTDHYFPPSYRGMHNVVKKLNWGPRLWKLNNDILRQARDFSPNIVWIDKSIMISPNTLTGLKGLRGKPLLVQYSPDDMMNKSNQSTYYLKSIPLFDVHITTKSYQVKELAAMGAPKIFFVDNAYCQHLHRPIKIDDCDRKQYGAVVAFIGSFEEDRYESIQKITEAGIEVRIWGEGWKRKTQEYNENMKIENRAIWGEEYVRAICSTDINLCFLRKANRDLQTTRSVEIPGCGGFMLAERTNEHKQLFEEDREAVFYSSDDDLVEKLKYFIHHPKERKRIAMAGRNRCLKSGYSNKNRLKMFFQDLI